MNCSTPGLLRGAISARTGTPVALTTTAMQTALPATATYGERLAEEQMPAVTVTRIASIAASADRADAARMEWVEAAGVPIMRLRPMDIPRLEAMPRRCRPRMQQVFPLDRRRPRRQRARQWRLRLECRRLSRLGLSPIRSIIS